MTTDKVSVLKMRARSTKELMERAERRGDDCHEQDNIRHCAEGVLDLIECDPTEAEHLEGVIGSLERRTIEMFKRRYPQSSQNEAPKPRDRT